MPSLQLALHLDRTDVFGTLEWVLANARRTGLTLQQMHLEDGRAYAVRLVCAAPAIELLELFVRRVAHGVDLDIVDAEFIDDSQDATPDAATLAPEALAA